ncbi:hypothetical protein GCM10023224_16260 [Streptomonospora halophila]|uniref:Uncharacterized protein n=2 Tax=Streptomonospora halophila TaxID=427369 RepID=A0ABP9GED6_9ACTN
MVVDSNGALHERRGNYYEATEYLLTSQEHASRVDDRAFEFLEDFPWLRARWIAPFDRSLAPANPVGAAMMQIFDPPGGPGDYRGTVVFIPSTQHTSDPVLYGPRLNLLLSIHREVSDALAAQGEPRHRLRPAEMITAATGTSAANARAACERLERHLPQTRFESVADLVRHLRDETTELPDWLQPE